MGDSIKVANEDDSAADDGSSPSEGFLWQYTDLLKYGKDKFEIISNINTCDKYIRITDDLINGLTDEFFEKTYLGFSYVVPETRIATEVQKTFHSYFVISTILVRSWNQWIAANHCITRIRTSQSSLKANAMMAPMCWVI